MAILVACLITHALLAALIPSPWWVPDLTLGGLVLAILRRPHHWLGLAVAAGLFAVVWAVRFPRPVFVSYLVLGWTVQALAGYWDATDRWIQWVIASCASAVMTLGFLWLDDLWSLRLLGLAAVHVAITSLAVALVQHGLQRARSVGLQGGRQRLS